MRDNKKLALNFHNIVQTEKGRTAYLTRYLLWTEGYMHLLVSYVFFSALSLLALVSWAMMVAMLRMSSTMSSCLLD
jgi:hypothetical protein